MAVRSFGNRKPLLGRDVFVDESAHVIGDVRLGDGCTVWPGAVLRADDDSIEVGAGTAFMDMSFAEAPEGRPVSVGVGCIISHGARLHGCRIGSGVLVGVGAIVLDDASVAAGSVVAAGSLVTPGSEIPERSVAMGSPAKIVRGTEEKDLQWLSKELGTIARKALVYKAQH